MCSLTCISYTHIDLFKPDITLSQSSKIAVCNRGTNSSELHICIKKKPLGKLMNSKKTRNSNV